jgi:sarcosine oxidase
MRHCDTIVIGLGATGSAALLALARRGVSALGIEQFAPGHDRGSSHGATRIIRLGYFEHPSYVPLVREAYERWRAIEAASTRKLFTITGILEAGLPDSGLVRGTLLASRLHKLPHEVLSSGELMHRFPAFRVPDDFVGVYQPDGGFLAAEPAVAAMIAEAVAAGARIETGAAARAITPTGGGVRVSTSREEFAARQVIVAAGPWLGQLLPDLPVNLRVTRQVLGWFAPASPVPLALGECPVFLIESAHGIHYGFPIHDNTGFKLAKHHHFDETTDPQTVNRDISPRDERALRDFLADHLPAANGARLDAKTCLYTMTPDGDFILDRLPGAPEIIVASPCSGHGFKFAPVIGEILADLAMSGTTARDISRFRFGRFG